MRFHRSLGITVSVAFLGALAACAGPTTPLGAPNSLDGETRDQPKPHAKRAIVTDPVAQSTGPSLQLKPDRQVFHDKSDLQITVQDPLGVPDDHRLQITYNGFDVTSSFMEGSERRYLDNGTKLQIRLNRLRLNTTRGHDIAIRYYRHNRWMSASTQLDPPECLIGDSERIRTTGKFHPPSKWLTRIRKSSEQYSINAGLITGLIAQESGFNPRALSSSKGLGLTQVTPVADTEIADEHPEWPRHEAVEDLPVAILRSMISSGRVTGANDWRLDPERSIQGGASYLSYIERYWQQDSNATRVRETFEDANSASSEIILASYNSGISRVSNALREYGPWYLNSPDLRAARKYVRNVASYCYHFSHEGLENEDPS